MPTIPCVLTIGGLDPSGGAGLPADARAMQSFGAHSCGVTTAVIAQNTQGVSLVEPVAPATLEAQLHVLLADITPRAVKIGVLPTVGAVGVVRKWLPAGLPLVLDTVFAPSHGQSFSDERAIRSIIDQLVPRCTLLTPNIPEAALLRGRQLDDWEKVEEAARFLHERLGARNVLIKGGHWNGDKGEAVDLFFDGNEMVELRAPRVCGYEVRGTGCLLASAIAAQLAYDRPMLEAVRRAKTWLTRQIASAQAIGKGRRVTFPNAERGTRKPETSERETGAIRNNQALQLPEV